MTSPAPTDAALERCARVHRTLQQQPLLATRQWNNEHLIQTQRADWAPSLLPTDEALDLVQEATMCLKAEANVLELKAPVMIVGDIHGHFADLLELMRKTEGVKTYNFVDAGHQLTNTYLFMGDYVDRGSYGVEVVLFLLSLKLAQPQRVFLLRGNHETRGQTMRPMKGESDDGHALPPHLIGIHFKREAEIKYGRDFYKQVMLCFDALPLAALITYGTNRFLCIHGGLSPKMTDIASLREINRFREPELSGILCDILWSDPISADMEDEAWDGDKFHTVEYVPNWDRGGGQFFGVAAVKKFLHTNGLDGIIRAHQMEDGVFYNYREEGFKFPLVTTVFSASNYCGHDENRAGVIEVNDNSIKVLLLDPALENNLSSADFGSDVELPRPPESNLRQRRHSVIVDFGTDTNDIDSSMSHSAASLHTLGERERSSSNEAHASWEALRRVAGLNLTPQSIQDMLDNFTKDSSRRPSQLHLDASVPLRSTDLGQLSVMFDMIDTNGDGVLQVDELKTFMSSLYTMYDEPSTQDLFAMIDCNGDGVIEFAEFAAFFANLKLKGSTTPV